MTIILSSINNNNARMAELADAGDLKSPFHKEVRVQVPLRAPTKENLKCMTNAIYFEARGESYLGKVAVGYVVLNRSINRNISICDVVNEPNQFSWNSENNIPLILNKKVWNDIYEISYKVISNELNDPTNGSTYFHSTNINPYWSEDIPITVLIGNHKFYNNI